MRRVVADRAAQHRVASLEGIQDGAQRGRALHLEFYVAVDFRQGAQMGRKHDSDHERVWTSTDRTGGRCWAMAVQVSPLSGEAYTCPRVVPKYTPHWSSESTAMESRSTFT